MIAATTAATPTGTSQARTRPIRRRTGLAAGDAGRPGTGLLSAWASSGGMIAAAAVSASVSRSAVAVHLFLRNHRVSLSARARAASPRAAVDLTVPALMPSVAAISASDNPT